MRTWLVLVALLLPLPVWAAPAVIGTPASGNTGASNTLTPITIPATCPSGNNNVVAVACFGTHKAATTAVTGTAATWNGTAMTSIGTLTEAASSGSFAQLFLLANPTCDGVAHNVVFSWTTTLQFAAGGILFLKDVDLTTPHDTVVSTSGTSSLPSLVVTSAVDDLVVDCTAARNSDVNLTAGAGQTLAYRDESTNATVSSNEEVAQSTEAGAAAVTMSYTGGQTSVSWVMVAASFNPMSGRRRVVPLQRFLHWFDARRGETSVRMP